MDRLSILRYEIDRLIVKNQPDMYRYFTVHLYEVSAFAVLLAHRRGLDAELAATCGILHDIYQITDGAIKKHAIKGAEVARVILEETSLYSEEEIEIITIAISTHNKKRIVHDSAYAELLKDADVLSHSLHDPGSPILDKEQERYSSLMTELGCENK
ncbi:MAG: HD domain-containing protein [Oscillospiraceae bacterium]|nr:HD domain-containing protein [Oscillospiraceae bacterium]